MIRPAATANLSPRWQSDSSACRQSQRYERASLARLREQSFPLRVWWDTHPRCKVLSGSGGSVARETLLSWQRRGWVVLAHQHRVPRRGCWSVYELTASGEEALNKAAETG